MRNRIVAVVMAFGLLPLAGLAWQQPGTAETGMKERCSQMMVRHEQMKAEVEAMDAKLDELVANMEAADADTRLDATVAVVEALVQQRKEIREKMMSTHTQMMGHMMEHMRMGMGESAGEGMQCPMMNEMMMEPSGAEPHSHEH